MTHGFMENWFVSGMKRKMDAFAVVLLWCDGRHLGFDIFFNAGQNNNNNKITTRNAEDSWIVKKFKTVNATETFCMC